MKLLLDKEPVFLTETVYDGQTEQGVEFDYVLPDYYPDIFKILKCTLTPGVVSYSVSGTQLFIDGVVYIKVLYLSEQSDDINCIEQRFTYSKTVELVKPAEKPMVSIFQKTDYCNCRAVSGRRIDIRGAVSCKVKVTGCTEGEILSGAEGLGAEVRRDRVSYCGSRLYASRQYVAREDIETGSGGGIASILTVSCSAAVTDTKIIADKVVIKGEARVRALYLTRTDGGMSTEVMEADVPLSQIVDVDGITDAHSCCARFDVMDCDLEIKQGDDGENRLLGCEITVDCKVNAYKEAEIMPLSDIYSTDYECNFTSVPVKLEHTPSYLTTQHSFRSVLDYSDGNISEVFDCRCDLSGYNVRSAEESGRIIISGQACIGLIGRNGNGKTTFLRILMGEQEYSGTITYPVAFDRFPYVLTPAQKAYPFAETYKQLKPGIELWKLTREMEKLGLMAEVLYNPFIILSHTEQTKVMLALLFSGENEFLLLYDPTNGLDVTERELVKNYLKEKKGFLLVSHDRDLLDTCVDHVLILNSNTMEVQKGNFSEWGENKSKRDAFLQVGK